MLSTEVHVWRAELDDAWPGPQGLPAEERERALAKRRLRAGKRWSASRWALRSVLSRYLDEDPATIALRTGEHGKPELAEDPGRLRFNLSHSGALALVAVATGPEVGVDVEATDAVRDFVALAERALDPAAAARVRAAAPGERAAVFYAEWVRHEARVKCLGVGLGGPPPAEAVSVTPLEVGPGYAAAAAVTGRAPRAWRSWSLG